MVLKELIVINNWIMGPYLHNADSHSCHQGGATALPPEAAEKVNLKTFYKAAVKSIFMGAALPQTTVMQRAIISAE